MDELFVGHAGTPLLARLQHDGGVIHVERSIVGGAVGAADGAEDGLDFRKRANDPVLLLQELEAWVMEIPGKAVGMYSEEPSNSGGMNWLPRRNTGEGDEQEGRFSRSVVLR